MRELIEQKAATMKTLPAMDSDFESSNVHSIGYDEPSMALFVRFWQDSKSKRSQVPGPIYKYFNVEKRIYLQMYYAKSKGKFVWERLRGRYRYSMIGRKGWRGPGYTQKKSRPKSMNPARNEKRMRPPRRRKSSGKKPAAAR
jgi:hypothetical protein